MYMQIQQMYLCLQQVDLKTFNTDVVMQSFTATIDSPAVFSGVTSTGYELVTRGAETAVTVDTQVKYDGNTKGFINSF